MRRTEPAPKIRPVPVRYPAASNCWARVALSVAGPRRCTISTTSEALRRAAQMLLTRSAVSSSQAPDRQQTPMRTVSGAAPGRIVMSAIRVRSSRLRPGRWWSALTTAGPRW